MNAIDLLSYKVKNYIKYKGWSKFRRIQETAIKRILSTENNYILSARTASGKTEAVFLPLLSKYDSKETGLRIVYISPLIALINDQFGRILELTKEFNIPVTKWHGEANRTAKKNLLKSPNGILLITPESIEAMLVNRPYEAKFLFENVESIVVDEIHTFVNSHRGTHLRSLLSRLNVSYFKKDVRYFGLSATCGNYYSDLKNYFPSSRDTKILIDDGKQERQTLIKYYKDEVGKLSSDLLHDLYKITDSKKSLVFPNSRGLVEEASVGLKKIAVKKKGRNKYFSHHSSIDKKFRQEIEYFAKTKDREAFTICCTSTLELGIDIGSIDQVIQLGSTHTVSSLSQRLGRSGRRNGVSNLMFLSRSKWDLVQSIAINEILHEGIVEPLIFNSYPVDILIHQLLSIIKECNGLSYASIIKAISKNDVFKNIPNNEIESLLKYLIENELLQYSNREYIIGFEGERLINRKDFYAIFETKEDYSVIYKNRVIGSLPLTVQIRPDSNIFLAAKIWSITEVDLKSKKIYVVKAQDGRKPKFEGEGLGRNAMIEMKMLELITSNYKPNDLDDSALVGLKEIRQHFSGYNIVNATIERPLYIDDDVSKFYPFAGSAVNNTLLVLYQKLIDEKINWDSESVAFEMRQSLKELSNTNKFITSNPEKIDRILSNVISELSDTLNTSKWSKYLPIKLKCKLLKQTLFDLESTLQFLNKVSITQINETSAYD